MREIKFRGKRVGEPNEFEYGNLIIKDNIPYIAEINQGFDLTDDNYEIYEVIPETVGQFVGLHDTNGTEIYEGDILEWTDKPLSKNKGIVTWVDNMFCVVYYRITGSQVRYKMNEFDDAVIIGNIHDNQSLLTNNKKTL